jgi:hypothetical protein
LWRALSRGREPTTPTIDLAVSAEAETEHSKGGSLEVAIEPRLVLSKDFAETNLTLNLVEQLPTEDGRAAFAPSFGFRVGTQGLLRVGGEAKYNTGTSRGAFVPQIWFAFPHEVTLKLGFSHSFGFSHEDFGRVALEVGI